MRKESEAESVQLSLLLLTNSLGCVSQHGNYELKIPDCTTFAKGTWLTAIGTVMPNLDTHFLSKKRLNLSAVRTASVTRYSVKYWWARLRLAIWNTRSWLVRLSQRSPFVTSNNLIKSLLLGEPLNRHSDQYLLFKTTGTLHLLSVSGTHLTQTLYMVQPLLSRFSRSRRVVLSLGMTWLLVGLVGGNISVLRAALMHSYQLLAKSAGRSADSLLGWVLTGLMLLVWQPHQLANVSFQLSMVAVLVIILWMKSQPATLLGGLMMGEMTKPSLQLNVKKAHQLEKNDLTNWLHAVANQWLTECRLSCWIALAIAPITLWHFGEVSLITVVATPTVSFLFPWMLSLGYIQLALTTFRQFVPLLQPALMACEVVTASCVALFNLLITPFSSWSWLSVTEVTVLWWQMALWYGLLGGAYRWWRWEKNAATTRHASLWQQYSLETPGCHHE